MIGRRIVSMAVAILPRPLATLVMDVYCTLRPRI